MDQDGESQESSRQSPILDPSASASYDVMEAAMGRTYLERGGACQNISMAVADMMESRVVAKLCNEALKACGVEFGRRDFIESCSFGRKYTSRIA
jgi:hypothetical protein